MLCVPHSASVVQLSPVVRHCSARQSNSGVSVGGVKDDNTLKDNVSSSLKTILGGHSWGPALGQAGQFTRPNRWRSSMDGLKVLWVPVRFGVYCFCNSFNPARVVIRHVVITVESGC